MKQFIVFCMLAIFSVPAMADELSDARELYNVAKNVCAGVPQELAKVSGVSVANTVVGAAGTAVSGGALAVGIAKKDVDAQINTLVQEMCEAGACDADGVLNMNNDDFKAGVIVPMSKMAVLINQAKKAEKLGNWRTGLMGGTIATNLANSILSGINRNQSELIQQIQACNSAVAMLVPYKQKLIAAGINPMQEPLVKKIDGIATWCSPLDITDVEKIERRMTAVMGTGIAGAAIGVAGTATSAAANSEKNRIFTTDETELQKRNNLNVASNVLAGANVATGAVETGLGISLINLSKKMIKQAELCVEAF